ncbi:XTP/dITP diphosphatase [Desulfotomaculum copahuensis]|uniref:dITP/XTP pyrophosphatase n=1 Tax=Desulfotomaculum copahuensis TaxID=1838280 RepID=A0A1B7LFK9_9FIRM|nr:XTP/dITP diphosphatase [Desulfotomaculum copahuensis]OAT82382.1 non-canonical purine NTP pyrophosphatase [Desulfotomaculum copahuensis]
MQLVLATRNEGKIRELTALIAPLGFTISSLADYPQIPEVVEDGATFEENAVKKARAVAAAAGCPALADDSGLEVDYLGGAPGVYSARFAGRGHDDRANNEKLLQMLRGVPAEKRTARFRCVVAVATPGGLVYTTEGVCAGMIGEEPRGKGGFGYDPLFYIPEYGKTFAELDPFIKNQISHRGRALTGTWNILAELKKEKS